MSRPNVFALKNNGLNAFLFAEVGTEINGSTLTVLSVLARLGQDPWAQAARWVSLPKADTVERLAGCIAKMPLAPQSLLEAHETAARLSLLLPETIDVSDLSDASPDGGPNGGPGGGVPVVRIVGAMVAVVVVAVVIGLSMIPRIATPDAAAGPPHTTTATRSSD